MEGGRALIEVTYTIAENAPIASGVYRLKLEGDTSAITAPGQFLDLRLPDFFLRRPISICDWDERSVTLLYKVVGGGTDWLSRCTPGQALDALSGLGNGFDVAACGETTLLSGGGIGTAPLFGLAKRLLAAGKTPVAVLGFNTAEDVFYENEFKELGVQTVVCKATDETQRRALEKIGADHVVVPERESGIKLAQSLTSSSILDFIELSPDCGIAELQTPPEWCGKSIRELDIRAKYGVNVIAVRENGKVHVTLDANRPLNDKLTLVLLGENDRLARVKP